MGLLLTRHRRARWAVPGLVAGFIALLVVISSSLSASASDHPALPHRTAAQLLAAVQQADVPGLSGTVETSAHLGLPPLPNVGNGGDASLSPQTLLTGSRTARVWLAGPTKQRLALLGQLAESDVIHNGKDLWTYSSTTQQVTHLRLTRAADGHATERTAPVLTPQQAAERALAAIDPTTAVTVDATARVAGRPAYQLVLTPRDTRSLIGSVWMALDSRTSVPLRVQVFAKGKSTPAYQVGFTKVHFAVPDASVFAFTPPAGATVKERAVTDQRPGGRRQATPSDGARPTMLGSGWTAVVEIPGALDAGNPRAGHWLRELSTPVPGGRVITSALLTVLVADDGTVYVGPVPSADLQRVAATGHGL